MHDLVQSAIEAAGGLDQWNHVREISCDFSVSGLGFQLRGPIGEAVSSLPMQVTVNTLEQKVAFEPFVDIGHRAIYEPHRTVVETSSGDVFEELDNPRESLEMMNAGTPWNRTQLSYFFGYALWLYFTLPFNFLKHGIQVEEVDPWIEDGEVWRGLKVTYPKDFPAHSTEQVHYFDASGLMRRQDYTVDVRQDVSVAHYMFDHDEFDGLVFPKKRRIYPRGADGAPARDRVLIAADLENYRVSRRTA